MGDKMKMKNSLFLIGMGVGGTLLYQQIKVSARRNGDDSQYYVTKS